MWFLPTLIIAVSNAVRVNGSSCITLAIGRIDQPSMPWSCASGATPSYTSTVVIALVDGHHQRGLDHRVDGRARTRFNMKEWNS